MGEKVWFVIDRSMMYKGKPIYKLCYDNTGSKVDKSSAQEEILLSEKAGNLSFRELIYRYEQGISFELTIRWKTKEQQEINKKYPKYYVNSKLIIADGDNILPGII